MGQAILYCSGCSTQLRDRDFEKGAAFRWEGRSYCSQCAPAEARSSAPPPPARKPGDETSRHLKAVPAPGTTRRMEADGKSPKVLIIAGGGLLALFVILAMAMSAKDPVRPPFDSAPPDPAPSPAPAPLPPAPTDDDRAAEDALRKARDFARSRPDDLAGQLALFDAAVRASGNTGHAVTAARERDAVISRQKAAAKVHLETLDAALKLASDKEDFGAALKLIDDAREKPMSPDWATELETRSQAVRETAGKLFEGVKKQAAEARKKGAEDEVRRQTQRVEKWGIDAYRSELAKAVAAATPKPKPPPPSPPKEIDVYRKRWSEAMTLAAGRDYAAAIRKIEEGKPATPDPAVQAETAADLEVLRLAQAAAEDAVQTLSKSPKGQKLTVSVLSETGQLVELSGTVVRADAQEIEIAREKGSGPVPVGEVAARSLAQAVKARRDARGLAVFCLAEGDPEGAKTFVEAASSVPEKYWAHGEKLAKAPSAADAAARRLYYLADHELQTHAKAVVAAQRFAGLLKDQAETPFVRRNKALLASRAEALREFFFLFEDLRAGGGFKAMKGEKDEVYWKLPVEGDPAKIADNFVELAFAVPADAELRCWVYVGGCCSESVAFSTQIGDNTDPGGEPALVKQSLSMPFRTHASHAGRGRPVPRWGWVQVPLPKFGAAGLKKVRLVSAQQNFCVAEAVVSATRQAVPAPGELKELERVRTELRGSRADPSLVACWKMADGSGTTAADSSPSALNGTLQNGAAWVAGTITPWNPPSLKLSGTGYANLGANLSILQNATAVTMSAWICVDKLGGDKDLSPILSISRFTGATPTQESRATMGLANIGCLSVGARSADTDKGQGLRTTERLIKAGVWTHVAGVIEYPTNSITAYVNGVIQPMTGTAVKFGAKATPNTPSTCGTIGSEDDGTKWYFQGRLADVRIYNRALGKDEIAELAVPGAAIR